MLRNSFLLTHFISDSRERVDQVVREKEKLRLDLDKAEKLKSLMASEVDDHHAAIERRNEYNLRCGRKGEAQEPSPVLPNPVYHLCPPPLRTGREEMADCRGRSRRSPGHTESVLGSPVLGCPLLSSKGGKDHLGFPIVLPHRKLDEEYKERIAALKSELRQEREQILQQAGKQRLELEQEIEKAKTEENYIRDRLALSLKVIFFLLVPWAGPTLGIHTEQSSPLRV